MGAAEGESEPLVRVLEPALDARQFGALRAAVRSLGTQALARSYWTTFWMPRGAAPAHAIEEAVAALWPLADPRACAGAEWWVGRAHTTHIPVGFHFDQDVKAKAGLRCPQLSSVLFVNRVKGGQLAVSDQRPGRAGQPRPAQPGRLQVVEPRPNRYAIFQGDRFHGVLDAHGNTPGRPLPGPKGALRVTLVVNYWRQRPSEVPTWLQSRAYPALRRKPAGRSSA